MASAGITLQAVSWKDNLGKREGSGGVLAEAIAEIRRKALFDDTSQKAGQRGGDGDQNPEQRRECKSYHGNGFERDCYRGPVQLYVDGADVGDELEAVYDQSSEQEGTDGEGADTDEQDVDGTCDVLTPATVSAVGEVLLVIGSHVRR